METTKHDTPAIIDRLLGWKPGKAERLARQRRLPHSLLPDGSIRFNRDEIESLIVRVPAIAITETEGTSND